MSDRVTVKMVDLQGRKFKIRKMDAYKGSYMLYTLMEQYLPLMLETQIKVGEGTLKDKLPQDRQPMSKQKFTDLMKDCLSCVWEVTGAGEIPALNENGTWRLNDASNNTPLVLGLVIHSLVFNIGDFFAGGGLKELQSSLQGIFPAHIKM